MINILEKAKDFAIEQHSKQNQLYGIFPYSKHLQDVDNVLLRFGFADDFNLRAAAWLHDILEDIKPAIPYELIVDMFGIDVFNIVYAVSDDTVGNRKKRKVLTFKKLSEYRLAIPLKLADRIANIEYSLVTSTVFLKMYIKEQIEFEKNLRDNSTNLCMWDHLDYLIMLGKYAIKLVDNGLGA